ncbi:MAG: hypothetical protein AAGI63_13470 [Planctomycetota bacterium]
MSISVQCPRCNGAVSIAEEAAGQRVMCPHCNQTFVAPGITKVVKDDDDWLSLDEVPLSPSKNDQPAATVPGSSNPTSTDPFDDDLLGAEFPSTELTSTELTNSDHSNSGSPSLSDDDEALLAEFTEDLDDFTLQTESLPKSDLGVGDTPDDPLSSFGFPDEPSATPKAKPAASVEYAEEYSVKCKLCGTLLYVKAHQAGQTLKCSDCHTPVLIPSPPKVTKQTKINIDQAETFQFEDSTASSSRGQDPFQRSAAELLEEASREEETSPSPTYDDIPSVKEWVSNVFGIFRDPSVIAHWVALSVLAALPTAIAVYSEQKILILGLFPAGFLMLVLVVSCGFAIMNAVANEEERVSDWPTMDPVNWMSELFAVVAAATVVVVPIWMLCLLAIGPTLASVALTMFAVYTLFPFILLSMMDMNSVMVPFSAEVARSVTGNHESWGGFYFSSGLLFAALFFLLVIVSGIGVVPAVVVGITAGIGVAFAYFSMMGKLAFAIGQTVNAPPRVDEVERSGQTEAS